MNPIAFALSPLSGLLEKLIDEAHAEKRRRHEEHMQEIAMISNSSLRDYYVQQLLLDKFLAPIEQAQHQLQNAAKHAQYLAEMVNYYHLDHGATQEQGKEISQQLRILATKITETSSLYDLKVIYKAATLLTHQLSNFKHRDRNYSLESAVRKGVLDVLNTCIAVENNFQRRAAWTITGQEKALPA